MAFAHALSLLLLAAPTPLPAADAEPLLARPGSALVAARVAPALAVPYGVPTALTTLAQADGPPGAPGGAVGGDLPPPPPWFDEVRTQRRALKELRRAMRDADKDARLDGFLRRRQEWRDQMELDRRLFLNWGPWLEPLGSYPSVFPGPSPTNPDPPPSGGAQDGLLHPPPGWDNRWYYNGW